MYIYIYIYIFHILYIFLCYKQTDDTKPITSVHVSETGANKPILAARLTYVENLQLPTLHTADCKDLPSSINTVWDKLPCEPETTEIKRCRPHILKMAVDAITFRGTSSETIVTCKDEVDILGIEKIYVVGPQIGFAGTSIKSPPNTPHTSQCASKAIILPSTPIYYTLISAECSFDEFEEQAIKDKRNQVAKVAQIKDLYFLFDCVNQLHRLEFAHCDIRGPNVINGNIINGNTSLHIVDSEYCCQLKDVRVGNLTNLHVFQFFKAWVGSIESLLKTYTNNKNDAIKDKNIIIEKNNIIIEIYKQHGGDITRLKNEITSMKEEITSMKEEITSINNEITSIQQELSQTTEAVKRLIGIVKKNSDQSINAFHRDISYVHDYYCLLA